MQLRQLFPGPAGCLQRVPVARTPSLRAGDTDLEIETAPPIVTDLGDMMPPIPSGRAVQGDLFEDKKTGDISTPYDPTLELSGYEYPVLPLLDNYEAQNVEIDRSELESNKDQIIETLLNYKIEIVKIRATIGQR